jgi:hypothetical protein
VRLRATLAALVAACGTLEPSQEETIVGTDGGVADAPPPPPPDDDAGADAQPADGAPTRVMHHLTSSFDEMPPLDPAFMWTLSNPGTITPGLFELDTSKFKSPTRSLHMNTSNTQVYIAQDLGDADEFSLQAWIDVETYSTSASSAAHLFEVHCDGSYGFTVRLAQTPSSIRFIDGTTDSAKSFTFTLNAWVIFTLSLTGSKIASYAIGGMGDSVPLSQPCLHPHLFVGVLPGPSSESANVRFDDLDLVWFTSK